MTDLNQARALLAQAVGVSHDVLPANATISTYDAWDSIAHMRLVFSIEEKLGAQLETVEILSLTSIEAIAEAIA